MQKELKVGLSSDNLVNYFNENDFSSVEKMLTKLVKEGKEDEVALTFIEVVKKIKKLQEEANKQISMGNTEQAISITIISLTFIFQGKILTDILNTINIGLPNMQNLYSAVEFYQRYYNDFLGYEIFALIAFILLFGKGLLDSSAGLSKTKEIEKFLSIVEMINTDKIKKY